MLDISPLPIGEESDLLLAIKHNSMNRNFNEILVSDAQYDWIRHLGSFYNHNTHGKIVHEYYCPFGEYIIEVKK